MSRLVFIDVDDTLLTPPYHAVRRVARIFGRQFPSEQEFLERKKILFYEAFPKTFRSAKEMWLFAILAIPFGYFRSQKALQSAPLSLSPLLKDHRVYLLSKNPPSFTRWRLKRIRELFQVDVGDRYIACGPMFRKGPSKIEIIRKIAEERCVPLSECLLIDDSAENVAATFENGSKAALIRSTWNRTEADLYDRNEHLPVVISPEEIAAVVTKHLGTNLELENNITLLTPPHSLRNLARLLCVLARRYWYYGEAISFGNIIPVARHPWTSYLYKDPQRNVRDRLATWIAKPSNVYGLRVYSLRGQCKPFQIPANFVQKPGCAGIQESVWRIRGICRQYFLKSGHKIVLESYFFFESLLREEEVERILCSPRLVSAIVAYAETHAVSKEKATQKAQDYARSIAANRTYLGAIATKLIIEFVMKRVFKKVIQTAHPKVREMEKTHFLIYASAHRSYLDSAILFATLAQQAQVFPFMVAADKMRDMWLGKLGTLSGALFLKRKFVDGIYAAILAEHITSMQKPGASLEVFLEGQRSRSGLTLPPKKGIASIIWSNIGTGSGELSKVAIVPVSFAYNKLPESELLVKESYEERSKRGEATLREAADIKIKQQRRKTFKQGARGLIRRVLSKKISECHIVFSEPIVLERTVAPDPSQDSLQLQAILNETMLRINAETAALPTSILCLGVLTAKERHLSKEMACLWLDLSTSILRLYDLAHIQTHLRNSSHEENIDALLTLPFINRKFKRHRVVEKEILTISGLDSQRAAYYYNNVLHFFVLPALLSFVLIDTNTGRKNELHRFFDHIFASLQAKYFLPPVKSAASFIDLLLDLFAVFRLVELRDERYSVVMSSEKDSLLLMLSRIGAEIFQDDLSDILSRLRRSYKRVDAKIATTLQLVAGTTETAGEIIYLNNGDIFLESDVHLKAGDMITFKPSFDATSIIHGSVTRKEQDGVIVCLSLSSGKTSTNVKTCTAGEVADSGQARTSGTYTYTQINHGVGILTSLSLSGAFVETSSDFSCGDVVKCNIHCLETSITLEGLVCRTTSAGIGIRFQNLNHTSNAQVLLLLANLDMVSDKEVVSSHT